VPSEAGPSKTAAQAQAQGKKKQTPNVRKILYAKKSLKDWLDELVSTICPGARFVAHGAAINAHPALPHCCRPSPRDSTQEAMFVLWIHRRVQMSALWRVELRSDVYRGT
jgi:hypothetical protein